MNSHCNFRKGCQDNIKDNLKNNHFAHNSAPLNPTEMVLYSKFTSLHAYQNKIIQVDILVENQIAMIVIIKGVLSNNGKFGFFEASRVGKKSNEKAQ